MFAYIGVTDYDWFNTLRRLPKLEEVNFWQPSGNRVFQALHPGELFLFKLHSPQDYIVGGGVFRYSNIFPISLAWETFTQANGANFLMEMRRRVARYRSQSDTNSDDYKIGCILLEQPFFFEKSKWITVPFDWKSNIVQGKKYDLSIEPGLSFFNTIKISMSIPYIVSEEKARYGEPIVTSLRLGQGSFRILVTDAYDRRCAITNERTLPALDAAHIIPFSDNGRHSVDNGLLLRRDIHALFDNGYITVTPSMNVEVSRKIKEEFENGRDYYKLQGSVIHLPSNPGYHPSTQHLKWHNDNKFKG